MNSDATIGTATMRSDGTIILVLRAKGGLIAHATITYPPDDRGYGDVLAHLGGLVPGESKLVLPGVLSQAGGSGR
jgi:hypothetical protein